MRDERFEVGRPRPGGRRVLGGSWRGPVRTDDDGAIAAEFVLLTSLIAGMTVGLAVAVGSSIEEPLKSLASVLAGLAGGS